jgi:UPF0176 protein
MQPGAIVVAALYRFSPFAEPEMLRGPILHRLRAENVRGTLLIAAEGLNGTIAGTQPAIESVIGYLRELPGCAELEVKYSHAVEMPFYRTKVTVKKEIVTLGLDGINPNEQAGQYVTPERWNSLILDPNTVVIDTRNDYEVRIGSFAGAVNPETETFRDFPTWFRAHRDELLNGKKQVAMFCTGGIRCEKSTSFLKSEGIDDVYHLQGGILKYLEVVPPEESLWEGECFVFDQRVSVGQGLQLGTHGRCHACRDPLNQEELQSPLYEEGVSCPHCHGSFEEDRLAGFAERQKQVNLAKQRGTTHVGQTRAPKAKRALDDHVDHHAI